MFKINIYSIAILVLVFNVQNLNANEILNNKSGVFISGKSSIIINKMNNGTNIIAKNIHTSSGGSIIRNDSSIMVPNMHTNNVEISINNNIPQSFTVQNAFPNPFNPTTTIKYGISKSDNVNINIYDVRGNLINSIKLGTKQPGWHEFTWNGKNKNDQKVSSGIYLLIVQTKNNIDSQKITMLE